MGDVRTTVMECDQPSLPGEKIQLTASIYQSDVPTTRTDSPLDGELSSPHIQYRLL